MQGPCTASCCSHVLMPDCSITPHLLCLQVLTSHKAAVEELQRWLGDESAVPADYGGCCPPPIEQNLTHQQLLELVEGLEGGATGGL